MATVGAGSIDRATFLAARALTLQENKEQSETFALRTESTAVLSPPLRPGAPLGLAPPPGLELPQEQKTVPQKQESKTDEQPVLKMPEEEPEQFKVLLQNLPEAMLKECMLRVMLEQSNLKDVKNLAFRSNGKALITFTDYASVHCCIKHFHGRQWGASTVTAMRVRTVKKDNNPGVGDVSTQEKNEKRMSTGAAVRAPKSHTLSADAPVFFPCADKLTRDRFFSYASTDVGSATSDEKGSDGCDSDAEAQVTCT